MCAKNKLETSTHTPPCRKSDFAMAKQKKQSKQKKKHYYVIIISKHI